MASARPLSVVQVLPELASGGVERGTLEVAQALVAAGHRSLVISGGGRMVAALEAAGSEHLTWNIGRKSPLTWRFVPRLRRLLAERGVDILHARSRVPAWVAYLAWRRMPADRRPRFVTTAHGVYSVNRFSEVMTRGECVIAVSESIRDYLRENFPRLDMARVRVIHRGVDAHAFPPGYEPEAQWITAWQAQFPELRNKYVLTLPGRITRLKGHRAFFRLLARLAARDAGVHGLIVGDADSSGKAYADDLRRQVASARLPISFAGHRNDMRDIYASSNLVLSLSSHPESFGRTVAEALSTGVPVLGYDHGGVGEVLQGAFPQGCVPAGDEEALFAKVLAFRDNSPRPVTPVPFTLEAMLSMTLALYDELASASPGAH
ncbi:MAG: glycosyltransferase [Hyphomicrobiales bacterium]|nr:MAG: glycosyltransferase [Hyphomicrobiales bacterium]